MATNGPFGQTNGRPTPNSGKFAVKYEIRDCAAPFPWLCRGVTFAYALLAVIAFAATLTMVQPQPLMAVESAQFFGFAALWGAWSVVLTLALACWGGPRRLSLAHAHPALLGAALWLLWVAAVAAVGAGAYGLGWLSDASWIARASGIAALIGWGLWWTLAGWREEYIQRLLAQEAQQAALLARTQPHFLFNSLNTIASLLPDQPEQAEQAIAALAKLLQLSLAPPHPWSLADELAATRTYLSLATLRYGNRLQPNWQMSGEGFEPSQVIVPRWVLQPLVENAIVHAVARRREPTVVEIAVTLAQQEVAVRVANPLPSDHPPGLSQTEGAPHHRLGLAIVGEQVRRWGGRIRVCQEAGRFVVAWHLPLKKGGAAARATWSEDGDLGHRR